MKQIDINEVNNAVEVLLDTLYYFMRMDWDEKDRSDCLYNLETTFDNVSWIRDLLIILVEEEKKKQD